MAEIKYVSLSNLNYYDGKIKEHIASADDTLKTNLEGQIEVVAGALDDEITRSKAAEATNAAAAASAQEDVDALAEKVGAVPEGSTVMGIITNIQESAYDDTEVRGLISDLNVNKADKTQVATDIADAVKAEEDARKEAVAGVQGAVDTLSGTHATDKKALEDAIALKANQTALDEVAEDVADIVKDYLVEADKTELQGKIDEKAAQTALDTEVQRATQAEAGLQNQINTIMNNPDAEGAINSINEFTAYVAEHGTIADGMRTDINKNKDDIAAMDTAYKAADTAIQSRLDVLEAIDHEAHIAADTALKNELNSEIAKKADASALESAIETLEGADAGLDERLQAVEAQLGDGENSVSDLIDTAKQEAIGAAAKDAANKDVVVLSEAQGYADELNTAMAERVATLEGASATHALASDVTALAGRVTTAEGEIDQLQTDVDAVEALAAANDAAIKALQTASATHATKTEVEAVSNRVTTLETWHNNFTEVSKEEINQLFA